MNSIKIPFLFILITLTNTLIQGSITSLILTKRQLCDIELLLNGGFAPLTGFMQQADYDTVVNTMRLANGHVWPMPIVLDVTEKQAHDITVGSSIALKDPEGFTLAYIKVAEVWQPDKAHEAQLVYGTQNTDHPGVKYLINNTGSHYVGGPVSLVMHPKHYDFQELRLTPDQVKAHLRAHGHTNVVAFQTRNPMHRAHYELTRRAAKQLGAHLLIHPVVGQTKPGDIDHFTRVRCYKKLLQFYPEKSATLSLLPLAMRMAGPREALWHALIRKNYGCTHFIVGRDHAGPGKDSTGKDFYGPYDAQELVKQYADEIGITMVPFQEMLYVENEDTYYPANEVPADAQVLSISGTQLRDMLQKGTAIPAWFSFPEVVEELYRSHKPRHQQGFTVFCTGLPSSGKSTIANALAIKLMEIQERSVSILDGDLVRHYLSTELGFSKEHRSLNVRRVGYVAHEITKSGGISICAMIAPFEEDRNHNRSLISEHGGYIEVYVGTPLATCEERDPKGLYAKARQGIIPQFTGISDPYEIPSRPTITVDSSIHTTEEIVAKIIALLKSEGYLL